MRIVANNRKCSKLILKGGSINLWRCLLVLLCLAPGCLIFYYSTYLDKIKQLKRVNVDDFSDNNLLGFNQREAKLAERVREVEEQNIILKRQLR